MGENTKSQKKKLQFFKYPKCTGTTHAQSFHLSVHKRCKYWVGEEIQQSRNSFNPKKFFFFFFFSNHSFLSREQCHTWVETGQKFFISSRTKCFKCKKQGFVQRITWSGNILFSSLWFALIHFIGLTKAGTTNVIWQWKAE